MVSIILYTLKWRIHYNVRCYHFCFVYESSGYWNILCNRNQLAEIMFWEEPVLLSSRQIYRWCTGIRATCMYRTVTNKRYIIISCAFIEIEYKFPMHSYMMGMQCLFDHFFQEGILFLNLINPNTGFDILFVQWWENIRRSRQCILIRHGKKKSK